MRALFLTPIKEEKKELFKDVECIFKDRNSVTQDDFHDIDIVFGNPKIDMINQSHVKWLQLDSAGANHMQGLREDIILTNAKGAYNISISEHLLAYTLFTTKKLFEYEKAQRKHEWNNLGAIPTLSELTIVVVGLGNIGSTYAKMMHSLGSTVYGVTRNEHDKPDYVEGIYTFNEMDEVLPKADIVVLVMPQTKETIHMFDYERFHKMKQGSIIMNVGRGSAIVENDLVKVMKEHYLSYACLDVTEHEPLPKNVDLWNIENVYITPHISGTFNTDVSYDTVIDIMQRNLQHYLKNESLENIVNRELGY